MEPTSVRAESDNDDDSGSRPPGGRSATFLLSLAAASFLGWTALRFAELDVDPRTAAAVALTQYALPTGIAISLIGLVLRRWLTTLVTGLVTTALFLSIAPRAVPDAPVNMEGQPIRVLSVNLHLGEGDARRVVQLVRERRVDVVSLQELTADAVERLDAAGLGAVLPHRVFQPERGGGGAGIASRHPLVPGPDMPSTTMRQPSVRVDLPGRDVELVSVHSLFPVGTNADGTHTTRTWRRELEALPDPARDDARTPRVLAGDFNATLDHTPMRGLIGQGYEDAAELTGDGLTPTWPGATGRRVPPVTIDHVLLSGGVAVRGYAVLDVPRTDHRAVFAHLVIPR